jgi:hypothetical protein
VREHRSNTPGLFPDVADRRSQLAHQVYAVHPQVGDCETDRDIDNQLGKCSVHNQRLFPI